jgi:hypothetical protein
MNASFLISNLEGNTATLRRHRSGWREKASGGESREDLQEHLCDLYADLFGGLVPSVRRIAELEVA